MLYFYLTLVTKWVHVQYFIKWVQKSSNQRKGDYQLPIMFLFFLNENTAKWQRCYVDRYVSCHFSERKHSGILPVSTSLMYPPSLSAQYCTCTFWTCNWLKSWPGGRCRHTFDLSSLGAKGGQTPGAAKRETKHSPNYLKGNHRSSQRCSWIGWMGTEGGEPPGGQRLQQKAPTIWVRHSGGRLGWPFLRQRTGAIGQLS